MLVLLFDAIANLVLAEEMRFDSVHEAGRVTGSFGLEAFQGARPVSAWLSETHPLSMGVRNS
jgi:hypothetical protein